MNSRGEEMYAIPQLADLRRQDKSLTLPEILSDPLIQAVMAADGVNPRDLAAELRRVALALPRQPVPDPYAERCYAC
ncbi:MAG: hypothetical protein JO134_10505 [Xanthobacteraceae bacterium]|nr:hypothetical protein [Xanthobacteraceae bacterium]